MRNFQDTFEIRKRSFLSVFPICVTVPLIPKNGMYRTIIVQTYEKGQEQSSSHSCTELSNGKHSFPL